LLDTHVFPIDGRHNHPLITPDEIKLNDGLKMRVNTQVLQGFSAEQSSMQPRV
jgi:hypothetical protein